MTRDEALIRKRLEDERADLISSIEAIQIENRNQEDDHGVDHHLADDATEVFIRERNMALRNNADDLLAQINAAFQRLDAGTYGICTRCGQPIAEERLDALPYAVYCITCQSVIERSR